MAQNPIISILKGLFLMASMTCAMLCGISIGLSTGIVLALEGDVTRVRAFFENEVSRRALNRFLEDVQELWSACSLLLFITSFLMIMISSWGTIRSYADSFTRRMESVHAAWIALQADLNAADRERA
ncbi:hypothetical protein B0I37DRAFT_369474 [Chaetomium sp. MPI-CAGE-AT-0009]|nr:hypothetical protein B0I37DRAFT_369474 [Chaetomium sp. MPI-CAGE-AT-0009]